MCKVLIFGGTTEGRILAEYCMKRKYTHGSVWPQDMEERYFWKVSISIFMKAPWLPMRWKGL